MDTASASVSRTVKKPVIHSQAREIIYNVYKYMEKQYPGMSDKQLRIKVSEDCGKSASTVYRVLKESKQSPGEAKKFTTPHKKRPRKKTKSDFNDFNKCLLRRVINDFHVTEDERPTLKGVLRVLKERIQYEGSVSSLRKIILQLGFKWKRAENNKKMLIEKSDLHNIRLYFLRKIKEIRDAGHNIVYMDESSFHSSSVVSKTWTESKTKG